MYLINIIDTTGEPDIITQIIDKQLNPSYMKPEKHTQLCEHIADRLNENPDWGWECNKQRSLSMDKIQEKIETLNWHFWIGKEIAQIIRAIDVPHDATIDDLIMQYSQELAECACGDCGNITFTPKL